MTYHDDLNMEMSDHPSESMMNSAPVYDRLFEADINLANYDDSSIYYTQKEEELLQA
jgi:hypothetical protein